jgi:hypothetical protein
MTRSAFSLSFLAAGSRSPVRVDVGADLLKRVVTCGCAARNSNPELADEEVADLYVSQIPVIRATQGIAARHHWSCPQLIPDPGDRREIELTRKVRPG